MNPSSTFAVVASGLLLAAAQASATTLTFEDLAEGATLSDQYASLGAIFIPNAFSGAGGPTGAWATNTDMTITASDIGDLGTPSLVSGKVLRAFGNVYTSAGWLSEDGDPSFRIIFSSPVTSVSAAFAGVSIPEDVHLIAFNGAVQLMDVSSTLSTEQFTLSYAAASITSIIITPGSFDDWVGVDNITFTPAVPELSTYAMMGAGLVLLAFMRRRNC